LDIDPQPETRLPVDAATQRVLELARQLIERPSVTPDDAGCLELIGERLAKVGFTLERMDAGGVSNLWATLGHGAPVFAFAGHTDVVPAGPLDAWTHNPFTATIDDGYVYGRGTADMKSSLAAMVVATEDFVAANERRFSGTLAFLLTSDEEGPSIHGTRHVMQVLRDRSLHIDRCVVGEPSSTAVIGDVIRNGRRGSLNLEIRIKGVQGHVAYPEQVINPIHRLAPALAELCAVVWDEGSANYPPTSMQVTNVQAGAGAVNVVPGELSMLINFRFSNALTALDIQQRTEAIFARHQLDFAAAWALSGNPFLTEPGDFTEVVRDSIRAVNGVESSLSTSGGTSDGRFIAPTGTALVELGPVNATIHKINERIAISELAPLARIYTNILQRTLLNP